MALKPCRECRREVSTTAKTCPNCGAPNPVGRTPARVGCLWIFGVVLAAILVIGYLSDEPSTTTVPLAPPAGTQGELSGEISVPSDPNSRYFALERGGTATMPTITTRRVGPSGTSYSRREYDCRAQTFRYLGEGDSREEMEASQPQRDMTPLVSGSISYYVGRAACAP
jgi:hypothetical protein